MSEMMVFCTANLWWIIIAVVIELVLKGMALWHSARRGQNVWFVFLLIINSIGILPLIYLILNRKKD